MKDPDNSPVLKEKGRQKASIFRTVKTVLWSFVGLRSRGGYENDVAQLNPLHIIIVGLVGVFVFVGSLILLASWVVGR
jgi:hypothetical protein